MVQTVHQSKRYGESSQAGDVRRPLESSPGVTADERATCLVLLDVDTGYTKAVPAAGMKAVDASLCNSSDVVFDCVVMGNPRLWPMAPR